MSSFVYVIRNTKSKAVKIGKANNPVKRLKTLQTGSLDKLEIAYIMSTNNPFKVEKVLHNIFGAFRKGGEWFELDEKHERLLLAIFNQVEATEAELSAFTRLGLR